jgi:surface antigen
MSITHKYFLSSLWRYIRPYSLYFLAFVVILALLFVGYHQRDNGDNGSQPIMRAISNPNFSISMDTVSESYLVSNVAASMDIPSSNFINENFVTINTLYEFGIYNQNETNLEKPNPIDTAGLTHDIAVEYTVKEGDNLDAIASAHGISTNDIRWSNKLKNNTVSPGTKLYLPTRPGILYTVKDGDSIDSLVSRYHADRDELIAFNDLEIRELAAGMTILLPSGELPETERPEYVAPRPPSRPTTSFTYYSVSGSSSRQNPRIIDSYANIVATHRGSPSVTQNPGSAGQCVWFAWYWRRQNMPSNYWIPTGSVGHGKSWATNRAREGFIVDRTPRYGDVVQTPGDPYYGHVGIVTKVFDDGSIEITEMNWFGWGRVSVSTAPASDAKNFWYIHEKR